MMLEASGPTLRRLLVVGCCAFGANTALAADAHQGKSIAERWCAGCHLVQSGQPTATEAPPFASIAKMPDFDAKKLALLLLKPHPNMPQLALSRDDVADLADYIAALK